MLRLVRCHIALILATPYLAAGCCSGGPPEHEGIEGAWSVQRTASAPQEGCDALPAQFLDLTIQADGDAPVVTFQPAVEIRNVDLTSSSVDFASSELPFLDSRSLVLVHHLTIAGDGQLTGTASGQGDGDQIHCRYEVTLTAQRIEGCGAP